MPAGVLMNEIDAFVPCLLKIIKEFDRRVLMADNFPKTWEDFKVGLEALG